MAYAVCRPRRETDQTAVQSTVIPTAAKSLTVEISSEVDDAILVEQIIWIDAPRLRLLTSGWHIAVWSEPRDQPSISFVCFTINSGIVWRRALLGRAGERMEAVCRMVKICSPNLGTVRAAHTLSSRLDLAGSGGACTFTDMYLLLRSIDALHPPDASPHRLTL